MLVSSTLQCSMLLLLVQAGRLYRPAVSRPHSHRCSAALEHIAVAELRI